MAIDDSDGKDYLPRSRKTRGIVALLTMTAPKTLQRGQVTGLFWSQREIAQGRASLRQSVHELQNGLGPAWGHVLIADRHCLGFDLRGVSVDAIEACGADAAKTALLTLFEEGYLQDVEGLDPAFDVWLARERRRMTVIARTAGEAFLEESHPRDVTIAAARSLLRLDPGHDGAWRMLIEAHISAGDRSAARFACEQWGLAMNLLPDDVPPPEMTLFLARIRFGAGYRPVENLHPVAGVTPAGAAEPVIVPDGPTLDQGQFTLEWVVSEGLLADGVISGRVMPVAAARDSSGHDNDAWNSDTGSATVPANPADARPADARPADARPADTSPAGNTSVDGALPPDRTGDEFVLRGETDRRILPHPLEPAASELPRSLFATAGAARQASAADPEPEIWQSAVSPWIGQEHRRSGLRLGIREMRVIGPDVDEDLAPGLAEEITLALARFQWLSCVSAPSQPAIIGETRASLPELDLDLLLDGTIQRGDDRVRITVRLLDLRAGESVIWARRFNQEASDTLAVQDRVAAAIAAQLDPLLLIREGDRAAGRSPLGASARELVLQAVPAIYRMDRLSFHAAGELLEAALRVDPTHTGALSWLAYWHLFLVGQGWTNDPDGATRRAGLLADTAVAMDPNDARALTLAGHVRSFLLRRPSEGAVLHERAISLNPNLALAWCFYGFNLSYTGNHAAALVRMHRAIELSPSDPHLFFFQAAVIMPHLLLGEYEQAAAAGRTALELNPWFSSSFKGCLAALGHLGHAREAAIVLARLLKMEPGFTVQDAIHRSPMNLTADIERYAEGLRLAGLPEGRVRLASVS